MNEIKRMIESYRELEKLSTEELKIKLLGTTPDRLEVQVLIDQRDLYRRTSRLLSSII